MKTRGAFERVGPSALCNQESILFVISIRSRLEAVPIFSDVPPY